MRIRLVSDNNRIEKVICQSNRRCILRASIGYAFSARPVIREQIVPCMEFPQIVTRADSPSSYISTAALRHCAFTRVDNRKSADSAASEGRTYAYRGKMFVTSIKSNTCDTCYFFREFVEGSTVKRGIPYLRMRRVDIARSLLFCANRKTPRSRLSN